MHGIKYKRVKFLSVAAEPETIREFSFVCFVFRFIWLLLLSYLYLVTSYIAIRYCLF